MKIELSIKTTYLPDWGTKEGVREIVQNAKDAETEFKSPMEISHDGNVLIVSNKNVKLSHEALLLGYTTKSDRNDMIGKYGEGLKAGSLALVRMGHKIKIMSGDEVWEPSLKRSENFQAEVLVFDITKGPNCGGVVVKIDKIPLSEWEEMRENFLFLREEMDKITVENYGELLLDSTMIGKIFVKGIFVQENPGLAAGYNLFNAPTDRDRKIIPQYDLEWRLAVIWSKAVSIRPKLVSRFYDLLLKNVADIETISSRTITNLSQEVRNMLVQIFVKEYGEDAIPVCSLLESRDIGHMGKRGVVLPNTMAKLLQNLMGFEGGIDTIKKRIGAEILEKHSWFNLTKEEQDNLDQAINIIDKSGERFPIEVLDIVSFRSDKQHGLYNGGISISKNILLNKISVLKTLIHEYAHYLTEGDDGEKSHVAKIENIWANIYAIKENNQ